MKENRECPMFMDALAIEARHHANPIEEVSFSDLYRGYQTAPSRTARRQTQLHKLIDLYIDIFRQWPWNEQYTQSQVLLKMQQELNMSTGRNPFLFIASQGTDPVGFAWGFQVPTISLPYWLFHGDMTTLLDRQQAMRTTLQHNRSSNGWYQGNVTYVAEIAVAPQARGGGVIAAQLMDRITQRQIIEGAPEYVSWTVRKADATIDGRSPRMYQMVEMLGGREVVSLGLLPSNPSLEKVVMGGTFYDAARVFSDHGENMGRYFLGQMRERRGGNLLV